MPMQRLLTSWEIAEFFLRHPLIADYVAKTKLFIASGTYQWSQTLPDWFLGLIPPWGTQVADSTFGNVTIYFGTDGTLYVSGFTAANTDINKPLPATVPFTCKDGSAPLPVLGTCPEDFNILYWIAGAGVLAFIVFLVYEARTKT
jgi:hypothetical protein